MEVVTETFEITHSVLESPLQLSIFVRKLYSLKLSFLFCEKSITVSSSQHGCNVEGEEIQRKHLENVSPTSKVAAAAASTTDNMNLNSNGFPPDRSFHILNFSRIVSFSSEFSLTRKCQLSHGRRGAYCLV